MSCDTIAVAFARAGCADLCVESISLSLISLSNCNASNVNCCNVNHDNAILLQQLSIDIAVLSLHRQKIEGQLCDLT